MHSRLASFLFTPLVTLVTLAPLVAQGERAGRRQEEGLELALGLIRRGLHDDAARQLQQWLRKQPRHERAAEAHYRLGTCLLELGEGDKAMKSFAKALERRGPFAYRAECRYRMGQELRQKKEKLEEAVEQFGLLVSELKQKGGHHYLTAPALYARGECLRDLDRSPEALACFRQAAQAEAEGEAEGESKTREKGKTAGRFGMPALYQAGFLLLRSEQFALAQETFAKAAASYPGHQAYGECRFLEGEAALRGGKHRAARSAFAKALEHGGEFADDALMGQGRAWLGAGDEAKALACFRQLAERFPKSELAPKAKIEAARLLHAADRHEETVQELASVLARKDLAPELRRAALDLRGLSLLELGQAAQAVEALREALGGALAGASDPAQKARMHQAVGEAQAELEDWQASLLAHAKAQGLAKDAGIHGDALYGQCLALHRLGRFEESSKKASELVEGHKGHRLYVTALFALAENHFAKKQYPEADKVYARIPAEHELQGQAAFKGAWCSYLVGDAKAAAARFAVLAKGRGDLAEESLSMAALAWLQTGELDRALGAADRYRARYGARAGEGRFLSRTERVAARALRQKGELEAASKRLARAAQAEKSRDRKATDQLELSELLFQQGDYKAARKSYGQLASDQSQVGAKAMEGLAWCAFELLDDEDCLAWIQKALAHPAVAVGEGAEGQGRPGLYELLSALHHRAGSWSLAEAAAKSFLDNCRGHARSQEMRYVMAVAQARGGKLRTARRSFQALATAGGKGLSRPDRLYYELAWVCRRLKDEAAALAAFAKVAQISKDRDLCGEAWLQLGEAGLAQKKLQPALEQLARVDGKHRGRALYLAGCACFEQGEFEQARPRFEALVGLGDGQELYTEGLFFLGECFLKTGKHRPASQQYQELLRIDPKHQRAQLARLHLGQAELSSGRLRQAAAVLEEFLRLEDREHASLRARGQLWLGTARQQASQLPAAEAAFRRVTDLVESELAAEAQFRIGECRKACGDVRGAADAFVKLCVLYGQEGWVQRGLMAAGDCYLELKKPKKARKFYQELVDKYPESAPGKAAKSKLEKIRSL